MKETGWLIELNASVSTRPSWYGLGEDGELGIVTDHLRAIRFARKWDAEQILNDLGWTEAFVCEHAWG